MEPYRFVYNYKENEHYRESFMALAKLVFGIDFHKWYENGHWDEGYICYSYAAGNDIMANVSVNKMTVQLNGQTYKAIQIGTVMTHPDARGLGLSKKLLQYVLAKYEQQCDFIYLFANKTVLDFYPKFGFEKLVEWQYELNANIVEIKSDSSIRPLNIECSDDYALLWELAKQRVPQSSQLDVVGREHLTMFYAINVFSKQLYYLENEKAIIVLEHEEETLHVYDIISKEKISFESIVGRLVTAHTKKIIPHFIVDSAHVTATPKMHDGDTLFALPAAKLMGEKLLFPLTSHA